MYIRVLYNDIGVFHGVEKLIKELEKQAEEDIEKGYNTDFLDEAVYDLNLILGKIEYEFNTYPKVPQNTIFAYTEEGYEQVKNLYKELNECLIDYGFNELEIIKLDISENRIKYKDNQQIGYI